MLDLATTRTRFREAALNYWVALREKDSDRANDETAAGDHLVQHWSEQGRAREFLAPMLRDHDPEVRFAAASHLLRHGDTEAAVNVLEQLQSERTGMIGPTARLRLMKWKRDGR